MVTKQPNDRMAFLAALGGALLTCSFSVQSQVRESFEISLPQAPSVVAVEGRTRLTFETHLTNFSRDTLTVTGIQIADADTGARLTSYAGADLLSRLQKVDTGGPGTIVAPGTRVVLYAEFDLPEGKTPRDLLATVEYRTEASPAILTVTGGRIHVDRTEPSVLGPPLRGGPWIAIHQADWPRGHRRVFYTFGGRARLPGRYAIDWVRVDDGGRIATGDSNQVSAHLGYGAEVLAVADAVVTTARNDVAESALVSGNPPKPVGDAAGNFIALRLRDGRYAIYEHLRPGSVTVKAGDKVRKGQKVGELGFTGDSTGPHLHLHVADAPAPLEGEGLPYVFEDFNRLGRYDEIGAVGQRRWRNEPTPVRHAEWPDANVVVEFPP